jgi:hypothetical protein
MLVIGSLDAAADAAAEITGKLDPRRGLTVLEQVAADGDDRKITAS